MSPTAAAAAFSIDGGAAVSIGAADDDAVTAAAAAAVSIGAADDDALQMVPRFS